MEVTRQIHHWEMKRRFNCGDYARKVRRGELKEVPKRPHKTKTSGASYVAPGTISETIWYKDLENNKVATVHRYRRADGTLDASGLPDPKALRIDGVKFTIYVDGKGIPFRKRLWLFVWGYFINGPWNLVCKVVMFLRDNRVLING
jgi:hypothetical protein